MKYDLDDTMNFGKYAGKTIKEVADLDPEYLHQCHKNDPDFQLQEDCAIYCFKKLTSSVA